MDTWLNLQGRLVFLSLLLLLLLGLQAKTKQFEWCKSAWKYDRVWLVFTPKNIRMHRAWMCGCKSLVGSDWRTYGFGHSKICHSDHLHPTPGVSHRRISQVVPVTSVQLSAKQSRLHWNQSTQAIISQRIEICDSVRFCHTNISIWNRT